MADTLITPMNDSFVDLDVLGSVDPETFSIAGISHYAQIVDDARRARQDLGQPDTDWIVLRNRLSMLSSRNKRFIGDALQDLSQQLRFRCVEGLAERVIFREFYPRGSDRHRRSQRDHARHARRPCRTSQRRWKCRACSPRS